VNLIDFSFSFVPFSKGCRKAEITPIVPDQGNACDGRRFFNHVQVCPLTCHNRFLL